MHFNSSIHNTRIILARQLDDSGIPFSSQSEVYTNFLWLRRYVVALQLDFLLYELLGAQVLEDT